MSQIIRWAALGLFATTCLAGSAFGQVGAEAGSQGAAINGDSSAFATRSPGRRLQELLGGPTITETSETIAEASPSDDDLKNAAIFGVISVLFTLLNQILPVLPAALAGGGDGGGILTNNTIVISELADDGNNAVIEIFNPGAIRVEMDGWAFCTSDECSNRLNNVVLEPSDVLVVQLDGNFDPTIANTLVSLRVSPDVGEIALYNFGSSPSDPTDASAMVDYLQWGGVISTFDLQGIASQRALWPNAQNSSIDNSLANNSFQLAPSLTQQAGRRAGDYIVVSFSTNSLGQATPSGLSGDGGTGNENDMTDSGDSIEDVVDDLTGGGRGGRGR